MLIIPRRCNFRKWHKGTKGAKFIESKLIWGISGLRTVEPARITAKQLEACRRRIRRHLPRTARVYIRPFTDRPISGKSTGSRIGKGKGAIQYWAIYTQPGQILFEVDGAEAVHINKALKRAAAKIPILTCLVQRRIPLA